MSLSPSEILFHIMINLKRYLMAFLRVYLWLSIIQYRDEPCALIVAETMLLSHEARLDRTPRTPIQEPLSVNLTQGSVSPSSPYYQLHMKFNPKCLVRTMCSTSIVLVEVAPMVLRWWQICRQS
ncbi:unnamed protein product [Vicia faba]|uniref:Uncharacterized protein n=1 Tax=Vicia faba TaxID=3906 RepID=A0AAV0ZZ65_VICFA|nr:unnamed protein product [Vicia faba]